jgi:hypothetical protein
MDIDENIISDELERILSEINEKISLADEGLLKTKVAEDFILNKERELDKVFPEDSKIQLKFQRLREDKLSKWRKVTHSIFVTKNSPLHKELFTLQEIIQELLKDCDPLFVFEKISRQNIFYFPQGDAFNAKRIIIKILRSTVNNIIIVDPYIDDTIFDYIEIIDQGLEIKILTSTKIKKIVCQLFQNIKNIRTNIQARQLDVFHDRYIIIDEKEIWHLGTSLNFLGKKAFQIDRLVTEEESKKILNDFNNWWQKGKVII